jgi:exosortase
MTLPASASHDVLPAGRWRAWALPGMVLVCWILTLRHLSPEWTYNEQYQYGWIVPVLSAYMIWMRREAAPATWGPAPPRMAVATAVLIVASLEALFVPLHESNPEWRFLGCSLASLSVFITLLAFAQARGIHWMGHFAFPVLFFFTAVPWPRPFETEVMQPLMQRNALLAAEIIRWFGIPAEVQGNLIRLSHETLGVDDACSGIRSLQSSLMATLFVGEIFALSWVKRALLLLAGAVWALVTNVVRTVILSLLAERRGSAALDDWHDSVGLWVVVACLVGVGATGWMLRGRNRSLKAEARHATHIGSKSDPWVRRLASSAAACCIGVFVIVASLVGTEWWFRHHEAAVTQLVAWDFRQPAQAGFERVEQPDRVRTSLRYDSHSGGRWRDSEGRLWVAHYFRWEPGANGVRAVIEVHDPRICIVATGKTLVQTLPVLRYAGREIDLPFDAYWFRDGNDDVFVFNCVVGDVQRGRERQPDPNIVTVASRLEAVRRGERNLGQRRLEVAVWGARDAGVAYQAFLKLLGTQLHEAVTDQQAP